MVSPDSTPPSSPSSRPPPRGWINLRTVFAQPARLFADAPESFDRTAVLEELWRALDAGQIRHQVDFGGHHITSELYGLTRRDPVDGRTVLVVEVWTRDVLDHPLAVPPRAIEICEEDVWAHFRAWLQQRQSPPKPTEPPELLAATVHGGTPPKGDSEDQVLEDFVRGWPERIRKGPKRETYNDWARRLLEGAKAKPELQGMHITQDKLRRAGKKIRQGPPQPL